MIGKLSALILLSTVYLVQTAEIPPQIPLTVVELGDSVTLQCPISKKDSKYCLWYKQPLGHMVQTVAVVILDSISVDSRFTLSKADSQYFLTIRNVSKGDEATYFCNSGGVFSQSFVNGIFLAVNDHNQQKCENVKQTPEKASVQPGDPVTLWCTVLSKNKKNKKEKKRVQCPDEHSVYWFRAGSGESHPAIIYTHRNRSNKEEGRSCVYSLSKTIRDSSDTGTYYCAVVTCGEILFGEGTKVDTRPELNLVAFVLGVLLACCATVIIIIFYLKRRRACEHCKGAMSAAHHPGHGKSTVDQSHDLVNIRDHAVKEVHYAALDFSARKVKRGKKKRASPQECVYSAVRADYHNQQLPSMLAEHSL